MCSVLQTEFPVGLMPAGDPSLSMYWFPYHFPRHVMINGRLAIARLLVDNNSEGEYAIIPASVADKIAQRDASSIVLHSALSAEEQDEDDPYADFKVPDDLMW